VDEAAAERALAVGRAYVPAFRAGLADPGFVDDLGAVATRVVPVALVALALQAFDQAVRAMSGGVFAFAPFDDDADLGGGSRDDGRAELTAVHEPAVEMQPPPRWPRASERISLDGTLSGGERRRTSRRRSPPGTVSP
jgi:hypothetical protein